MRTRQYALSLATVSALALASSMVLADTNPGAPGAPEGLNEQVRKPSGAAHVTLVASGAKRGRIDGEMKLRYPGFEQTTLVNTKGHIVLITMEAVKEPNRGPVQCSCSSYQLQANGPPKEIVSLKRLTEYTSGERTCNHPKAASDNLGNIVWVYGSDGPVNGQDSNRPNFYAGILNEKCETLASPTMVSIMRDANDGGGDIDTLADGSFIAGYYSDGGDPTTGFPAPGGDYSVAMHLAVRNTGLLPTLERTWIKEVITPTQIGRPTIAAMSADRALFCAGKGPNRPSDNIECGLIDTNAGVVLSKAEFLKGNRDQNMGMRSYFNQPTVVKVADNQFALMGIESNGMGKNTNVKGSNKTTMMMIEKNGDILTGGGAIQGIGAHQTHASICVGSYGEQGATAVGVFSASPTGIGRAALSMVQYDKDTKSFTSDPKADTWPAAWYGDSGHLSNWYGRNPMRQGRDYLRCIGNVQNPGYHVPGGYMADVKTFYAAAVHGRVPGDEKNSLFLSLVPGHMDKKVLPENPVPAGEPPPPEEDTSLLKTEQPKDSNGCGCTTPGTSTGGTAAFAGAALALGIVISRRRRNK